MKNVDIKFLTKSSIIAALYVVLTWVLSPISYGAIQFRISEILILLVVFNKKYAIGLILGCFIANTISPLGWFDMVFGTLATILAIIPMLFVKKVYIAGIFPVISNSIIVSLELGLAFDLFYPSAILYNMVTIFIGEFVVIYLLGIPTFYSFSKNEYLINLLELDFKDNYLDNKIFTKRNLICFIIIVLTIVFFFAFPIGRQKEIIDGEIKSQRYRPINLIIEDHANYLFMLLSPVLFSLICLFCKAPICKFILGIISSLIVIITIVIFGISYQESLRYIYFYGYLLLPIFILCMAFIEYNYEIS